MSRYTQRQHSRDTRYAVASGRQTGIFEHYRSQLHPSTNRYPSNIHQRFSSLEEAERALNRSGSFDTGTGPYYAVRSGRNTGIYRDWLRAAPEVLGYPHNEHRRFEDRSSAEGYMRGGGPERPRPGAGLSPQHGGRFGTSGYRSGPFFGPGSANRPGGYYNLGGYGYDSGEAGQRGVEAQGEQYYYDERGEEYDVEEFDEDHDDGLDFGEGWDYGGSDRDDGLEDGGRDGAYDDSSGDYDCSYDDDGGDYDCGYEYDSE
ncbi:hypothetical protein TWF481_009229 [Arthrobotrys musiformis]|uniref:Ribonuclease H1 N-terminal domain-containing protein n=1 Tax=Arthrobotrys musiformis TaxID=47236 RepID=A0AAV9W357_9PEZI